jgi:hypothetical protein
MMTAPGHPERRQEERAVEVDDVPANEDVETSAVDDIDRDERPAETPKGNEDVEQNIL